MPLPRRTLLALAGLALPALPSRAAGRVPPFPEWIGRTARLKSDDGHARLLLERDRTGMITVRAFFLCHPLPVLEWRIADDGLTLTYRRQAAISASRIIEGTARIAAGGDRVQWIEARDRLAEFEGFEPAEAVRACA